MHLLESINNFNLKKAVQENVTENLMVDNSFYYYNVDDEKLYGVTQIKVTLPTGASSIIDYMVEL